MRNSEEFPIDPAGVLSTGESFSDYPGLRDVVAGKVDAFARGLAESLIEYGLGRPYGFTDQDLADDIISHAKDGDYELSRFIHALIQSQPFRSR